MELRTQSLHVGGWHVSRHTPEPQSAPERHGAPSPHSAQDPPPQSIPVSLPFLTLSPHEGAAQIPLLGHTPEAQSLASRQCRPLAHGGQDPPQSTSVSEPFSALLEQEPFRQ